MVPATAGKLAGQEVFGLKQLICILVTLAVSAGLLFLVSAPINNEAEGEHGEGTHAEESHDAHGEAAHEEETQDAHGEAAHEEEPAAAH